MSKSRKEEINDIVVGLGVKDAEIRMTNNGHYEIKSPSLSRQVFTSSTPSDRRSNFNLKSEIRGAIDQLRAGALSAESAYNDEDISDIVNFSKTSDVDTTIKKFSIGKATLRGWQKAAGMTVKVRNSSLLTNEEKNKIIDQVLAGKKIPELTKEHPKAKGNAIYNIMHKFREKGYYPVDKAKAVTKKDIARDVSYMTSGAKSAHKNDEFDAAIALLSGMGNKIRELNERVKQVEGERDEYKAKLALISEAMNL